MAAKDLDLARAFKRVAETRSFRAAAQDLDMRSSSISRQITKLEESIGVRLLVRTTRYVHLTDAGKLFYAHCSNGISEVEAAWDAVSIFRSEPQGLLRIWSTPCFGKLHIVPAVSDFTARHPKLTADLSLGYWSEGFMESGVDVQICGATLKGSKRLAYKHLAQMEHRICATPQYLEKHGRPGSPMELSRFNCITNTRGLGAAWPFTWNGRRLRVEVSGNMRFDNLEAVRHATLCGHGIARLPSYLVASDLKNKKLMSVFPMCDDGRKGAAFATSSYAIKIYYDGSKLRDLKVSAFVDYLVDRFRHDYDWQAA